MRPDADPAPPPLMGLGIQSDATKHERENAAAEEKQAMRAIFEQEMREAKRNFQQRVGANQQKADLAKAGMIQEYEKRIDELTKTNQELDKKFQDTKRENEAIRIDEFHQILYVHDFHC